MSQTTELPPRPQRSQRRWVIAALVMLFLTLLAALPAGQYLFAPGAPFGAKPGTRAPVWQVALFQPGMGLKERWQWLMVGGKHMTVAQTTPCKSCHR